MTVREISTQEAPVQIRVNVSYCVALKLIAPASWSPIECVTVQEVAKINVQVDPGARPVFAIEVMAVLPVMFAALASSGRTSAVALVTDGIPIAERVLAPLADTEIDPSTIDAGTVVPLIATAFVVQSKKQLFTCHLDAAGRLLNRIPLVHTAPPKFHVFAAIIWPEPDSIRMPSVYPSWFSAPRMWQFTAPL